MRLKGSENFVYIFMYSSSYPIKMLATDAKTLKINPGLNFDGWKFQRQCVNMIDTKWGPIYFLMYENFGLSV